MDSVKNKLDSFKYELDANIGTVTDMGVRISYETVIQLVVNIVLASGFFIMIFEIISL